MDILVRGDGEALFGSGSAFRVVVPAARTGGALSIVRQSMQPRALIAGHVHERNDVWVQVLEGRVGARVGDAEAVAGPGEFLLKPRAVRHAMWNPDDEPNLLIEILTPGSGEDFFRGIAGLEPGAGRAAFLEMSARCGVRWFDDWTGDLVARHGLRSA